MSETVPTEVTQAEIYTPPMWKKWTLGTIVTLAAMALIIARMQRPERVEIEIIADSWASLEKISEGSPYFLNGEILAGVVSSDPVLLPSGESKLTVRLRDDPEIVRLATRVGNLHSVKALHFNGIFPQDADRVLQPALICKTSGQKEKATKPYRLYSHAIEIHIYPDDIAKGIGIGTVVEDESGLRTAECIAQYSMVDEDSGDDVRVLVFAPEMIDGLPERLARKGNVFDLIQTKIERDEISEVHRIGVPAVVVRFADKGAKPQTSFRLRRDHFELVLGEIDFAPGLGVGSSLEEKLGRKIGDCIKEFSEETAEGRTLRVLRFSVVDDPIVLSKVFRAKNKFSVDYARVNKLEVTGARRALTGSALVVSYGDEDADIVHRFGLRQDFIELVLNEEDNAPGIGVGSPLEEKHGRKIGHCIREYSEKSSDGENLRILLFSLVDDPAVLLQASNPGNRFDISYPRIDRLEIEAAHRAVSGSAVVITYGKEEGDSVRRFGLRRDHIYIEATTGTELAGIGVGTRLTSGGTLYGRVDKTEVLSDGRRRFRVNLVNDKSIIARAMEPKNKVYLGATQIERANVYSPEKMLNGAEFVMVVIGSSKTSSPETPTDKATVTSFQLIPELPPPVPYGGIEIRVSMRNPLGIGRLAPFRVNGNTEGCIVNVQRGSGANLTTATIRMNETDLRSSLVCRRSTRFIMNLANVSSQGVEGDSTTLLYGPVMEAWIDPTDKSPGGKVTSFILENTPPLRYLPQEGERRIRFWSGEKLAADIPIKILGEVIGYIHSCQSRKGEFLVEARIYPGGLKHLTNRSKFFIAQSMEFHGPEVGWSADWKLPSIDLPRLDQVTELVNRIVIEVRAPDDADELFDFKRNETYPTRIHATPEREWKDEWNTLPHLRY